ncbi:MAG: branched-chain amino acid transport system II carrier protein [Erysipelotrichaceae bacterium]|nr:branched-chain amino acid transport system II carrier protein [Erysipelotrichaceae bacterium]
MKIKLNFFESMIVGSLIFGLLFGAGNLIFPVYLGYLSGDKLFMSSIGFLISAVGIPLLGLIGAAISKKDSLFELAKPISRKYSLFFTVILYLTIGPFFAIPRTSTVAYAVGITPFLSEEMIKIGLLIFTIVFFLLVLIFSLKPNNLLDYVGKYLTPIFLILLSILLINSIFNPINAFQSASSEYSKNALILGLYEGYNTMDGIAVLAYSIVIISAIRGLKVTDSNRIAKEIFKSGVIMSLFLGIIYIALIYLGATSSTLFENAENGSVILSTVSKHYLGIFGSVLMALIIIFACLKTAIGLVVSSSEMFYEMFNKKISYKTYVFIFTGISFLIANIGLSNIIQFSIPVLLFIYPLAIVLIILCLMFPIIKNNKYIYFYSTLFTLFVSVLTLIKSINELFMKYYNETNIEIFNKLSSLTSYFSIFHKYIPWFNIGFGWVLPSLIGFLIGVILTWKYGYSEVE